VISRDKRKFLIEDRISGTGTFRVNPTDLPTA
jgi:hypothetical protein